MLINIQDHSDLKRDMSSKAIINSNRLAFEQAKASRQKRMNSEIRLEKLETEMLDVKRMIREILEAVKK